MITLHKEKLKDILPEIKHLLELHYEEIALNKTKMKLSPVWEDYFSLEENNQFHSFVIRSDNEIIGYTGFILKPHFHYRDTLVAQNDVLFLKKDQRQGTVGIRLLRYSENQMKLLGADKITWHVKLTNDFRNIFYRMGYVDEDVIVGKFL